MSKVEQLQEALEKSESQLAECRQNLVQRKEELQRKEATLLEVRKLKKGRRMDGGEKGSGNAEWTL